jgi:hypothetical protein
MTLSRKGSVEFLFSGSFDQVRCQNQLDALQKAKEKEEQEQAAKDRNESEMLADKLVVIGSIMNRTKEIGFQVYCNIVTLTNHAKQHFSAISKRSKNDDMAMLKLYVACITNFLIVAEGQPTEWMVENACHVIDMNSIQSMRTKYPDDEVVIAELENYWRQANRAALMMGGAYIDKGMLDPALDILFHMNELLMSFPDHHFNQLCWGGEQGLKSFQLDQLLMDGLGFASDFESLYPGRGSCLMLHYAMIRIFSYGAPRDFFILNDQLNNAVSTLRRPDVALTQQLNATHQLFKRALQKAFNLAKNNVKDFIPAIMRM